VNGLNLIFGVPATLSCILVLWQFFAARRFPLHQKNSDPDFTPAISLLKPVKGCDTTTAVSLESWFRQNYGGQIEIIFGVNDAGDPAAEIIRALLKKYPQTEARLVVCENPAGTNAKVAKLAQLEKLAQHDLLLTSDADVRVPPDFITNFIVPLRDNATALVNCFYCLANPTTNAMKWEAIAINADFWSQVLQAQTLKPLDFALGAAIVLRRKCLEEIGGFPSLADCLADDYQLGRHIFNHGHRIALSPVIVECWEAPMTWRQVWKHQLRWARTIRVCRTWPYFLSILSNATLWSLLWLGVSLVTTNAFCAPLIAIIFLLVRIVTAQSQQRRFTAERKLISPFWLVPVKDLLQTAIWFCAFTGDTVEWRGRKMKVRPDGTLMEVK
jgi:ceramide glucosyltransferase